MLLYQKKRKKSRGPSKTIRFRNTDISTVFEIIQMIYERDYKKMNALYGEKRIDTELALVIGAVTNSQRIIDQALELEVKGEEINMLKKSFLREKMSKK